MEPRPFEIAVADEQIEDLRRRLHAARLAPDFGNDDWRSDAPSLKSIEDALDIRHRILCAFERAEQTRDSALRKALLTFVVVGAGPTGVELAGAIGEMASQTLARDFKTFDPSTARVVLVEGFERVLDALDEVTQIELRKGDNDD